MQVLIIEDIREQRVLYRLALERVGAKCVEAASGKEALSLEWPIFDVVLCDILMPGMAGDEIIRLAAEKWGVTMPPVVVFTALDHRMIERLTLNLPACVEVHQKTGSRDAVLSTVRRAVQDAATHHSTRI
jgi:CheY-like chemotaxis protein